MSIYDKKWGSFKVSDLFKLETDNDISDSQNLPEGNYPLIAARKIKNGVDKFIDTEKINNKHAITWNKQGDGGAGLSFYQPVRFANKSTVFVLRPKKKLSKQQMIFIVSLLNKYHGIFDHGYGLTKSRFEELTIQLPILDDETPDWDLIQKYMFDLEQEKINKCIEYFNQKRNELSYKKLTPLEKKSWEQFYIGDLFTISSGKRLTQANMKSGATPFIGATALNNGITNYVNNTNNSMDKNVLGVNYNGSVVENFYHPYTCLFSDDVKRFHLKDYPDNRHVLLFFKTIILKQKVKYMYGYKFNAKRMKQQIILVPVDDEGDPDYEYMEQYMKNLEIKHLNKYINHINNQNFSEYISEKMSLMKQNS
ncbi:restriction endonuclease subunit S [uncultured Methanobrevibacter sp.]|uniref:restriction endonuclease subunit S n=1 Tax=uncultured Methanobrevibacter sp. TaxID=253161 RepID=UPI0025D05C27|nr:restriction endonuclease subunit S [uncultured Methanobrevibacter sp.]